MSSLRLSSAGMLGLLALCVAGSAVAADPAHAQVNHAEHGAVVPTASVPLYENLGSHHYAISSRVPQVQEYFDQGLRLYYAFNHAEAIRAFEEAARLDPDCAICHWGAALALGPNINLPMDSAAGVQAYAALQKAIAAQANASERERALIGALGTRYAAVPPADRAPLDSAYARAMATLAERYPDDLEIASLYAESLMDLRPWQYWTADGKPQPGMDRAIASLERVTARNPNHPGACHFYIHAVEEVYPKRAVPCAERLALQMPGAGHLVHMPGHIYIRVGRYLDAIKANEHATHADETFIRDQRPGAGVYTLGYYPHNYDFLAFAASMVGRERQAVDAAEKMQQIVPQELAGESGMTFMQHHMTRALQLYARFNRWDDILRAPEPAEGLVHARMMWQYGRGRALLARGDVAGATAALEAVRTAMRDSSLATMRLEFNTSLSVAKIAEGVLAGHLAAARGDHRAAEAHLRRAAQAEAALVYGEPPEWTVPVHQELGAVLLAAKRPADAERAFRADLERFPDNGWSLFGLAESLRAQGKTAAAREALAAYEKVWEGTQPPMASTAGR
ncbi:MAG TPA: tetratricopeptide repeat protein [Gemmatimonadaceae bacterium]|nr:tetratricopeptide repeat protein [Gemmatimonadaceae bacterium]